MSENADTRAPDIITNVSKETAKFIADAKNSTDPVAKDRVSDEELGSDDVRSIAPRPSKDAEAYWKKMDKHFEDILIDSKNAFKIKTVINILLVVIGAILIANAITYTWARGTSDGWGLFSGGIGMGVLTSIFFYKSQDAISKGVANLSVVDMVFKSHYRAYESITDYDYKADNSLPRREIGDLKEMLEILEKTTRAHVDLIHQIKMIESPSSQDSGDTKASD